MLSKSNTEPFAGLDITLESAPEDDNNAFLSVKQAEMLFQDGYGPQEIITYDRVKKVLREQVFFL